MPDDLIFRRKIYDDILRWKNSELEKPLLIEGARRVGKSFAAEHFEKDTDTPTFSINFADATNDVKGYFYDNIDNLNNLFKLLSAYYDKPLYEHRSVVIFDEIQEFPKARECLKRLVADGRYYYIETGSLISINKNMYEHTIPEERVLQMYPMDFEEFCWALGEEQLANDIKTSFLNRVPLGENEKSGDKKHKKAMELFREYILIGGMPQPVKMFVQNRDNLTKAEQEKWDILDLYRNDVKKATSASNFDVNALYSQLPGLLAKHDKEIGRENLCTGADIDKIEDPFSWLNESKMCNACYRCTTPDFDLTSHEDRTHAKCYMGDTGLLYSRTFGNEIPPNNDTLKRILRDKLSINEGMIYENAIAQMLKSSGHKLYFYSEYDKQHKPTMEIDFLITERNGIHNDCVSPIEIKSTNGKYTTKSLTAFRNKYRKEKRIGTCIVITPKPLYVDKEEDILYIPPYMTFCL